MLLTRTERVTRRQRPLPTDSSDALENRSLELLRTEINFIPNSEFRLRESTEARGFQGSPRAESSAPAPTELPAHLRRMCQSDLLTHQQETALFREMNYLKYRANTYRSRLNPDDVDPQSIATIEMLLAQAREIRDHIVKANMRLVMAIVKKFVSPQQSFDEMLSDGIMTLMHAVEKFDYGRGFRFSTYAYRSIARNAYRSVRATRQEEARFTRDAEEWAFEQPDHRTLSTMSDHVWGNLRELLTSMLDRLDRREQLIIRSRYALGAHRKVRTFQYLSEKLGVSKERVRQLEQRAVAKLRGMAAELELDELFGAAMA